MSSDKPDLLLLAETWLHKEEDLNKITFGKTLPKDYRIQHIPRPDGREGGGAAIVYQENVPVQYKSDNYNLKFKQFENILRLLCFKASSLFISVVYRPDPTSVNGLKVRSFWKDWRNFLSKVIAKYPNFIIFGDLNFHLDVKDNSYIKKFNNILNEFGLKQLVTSPTHVKGHTLDVVILPEESSIVSDISVCDPGFCNDYGTICKDHYIINTKLKTVKNRRKQKTITFRNWKKVDSTSFQQQLHSKLLSLPNLSDVNALAIAYYDCLSDLADVHAPVRTITVKTTLNPWHTEEIKELKRMCRQKERWYQKTKLTVDLQIFRDCCNILNKKIREAKIKHNKNAIIRCGYDQKKLFSFASRLMGNNQQREYPHDMSSQELADSFAQFFSNKAKKIQSDLKIKRQHLNGSASHLSGHVPHCEKLTDFSTITEKDTKDTITNLSNKQCLLDPVPTWFLKEHIDALLPLVTRIVNTSLSTADMPKLLKKAHVRPVIKEPSADAIPHKNYRPVSNLSVLGKIIEKVVYKQLNEHITSNNLLDPFQSAYRSAHSTETALLKVQNDILEYLDKGYYTALVMIDVSAAFDVVNHEQLLNCFRSRFNLDGNVLNWIESYLKNRTFCVSIGSTLSKEMPLERGFPQGAMLAGLFYSMYSTTLGDISDRHPSVDRHSYADDNGRYIAFRIQNKVSAVENLQNCLKDVKLWMTENLLKLNEDKTRLIIFSPSKTVNVDSIFITFNSEIVKPVAEIENLGVILDQNLTMERQVNSITSSAYFRLRGITKIRLFLDKHSTKSLVQALVISKIDYCNSLLSNLPKRLTYKLQKVQNSAARIIERTRRRDHITPVLRELHWLPVIYRIKFKVLLITYKCKQGIAPIYLQNLIPSYIPSRLLQSNDMLRGTLIRSSYKKRKHGGRAFRNVASKLWNDLPRNIREASSVSKFKTLLKTFYSNEYLPVN